jgi:hypothetical protein
MGVTCRMHGRMEDAIPTQCQSGLTTYAGFGHARFTEIDSRCKHVAESLQGTSSTVY